jgi:tRNA (guanine37-N1)-methyltransferase
MDGGEFVKKLVGDLAAKSGDDEFKTFDHALMNLPATALEFLGS